MLGETLGSYRIVKKIGEGGMGVVYLGLHSLLGRKAAIKALLPELSSSRDLVERFFLEARTAATIHHPGIVEVLDFGHDASGTAYLVMELLDGESLAGRLQRDRRLPLPVALAITRQVASALHAAHEKGIVHRDLKPENLFLTADPEATSGVRTKVLDFGIAKLTRAGESTVKTKTGMIIGTPRYMSPEQCRDSAAVDCRADIYALGCILYEMIVGERVFPYNTYNELVGAHLYEIPPSPRQKDPTLPPAVEAIVMRAIAKNADDRFATMAELARELETAWRAISGSDSVQRFTPMPEIGEEETELASVSWSKPPTIGDIPQHRHSGGTLPVAAEVASKTGPRRRTWLPVTVVLGSIGAIAVVAALVSGGSPAAEHTEDHAIASAGLPVPPPAAPAPAAAASVPETPATAADAATTPAQVRLVVDSVPSSADVYRFADGVKLGKTPFEHTFERIDGNAELVVKLAGYADARVEMSTLHDGTYVAHLVRDKHAAIAHHVAPATKPSEPKPPDPKVEAKPAEAKGSAAASSHGTLLDPYGGK